MPGLGPIALALLLAVQPPSPAPVSVQASSSTSEPGIGEPFAVELKAAAPAGTSFTFPGEAATEAFELRPVSGSQPGVQRYQAAVFALGEVEIPPLPVRYRLPDGTQGEVATQPIALRVRSLLPKDPGQRKLAEIRGPVDASIGRAFWIALVALVLAFSALAGFLSRRRLNEKPAAAARLPDLPADGEALRALAALAASDLLDRGEYRPFYIQLAAIAKRYLECRLQAPVLEMTSAETLAFLRGHAQGGPLLPVVRELAFAADRIKFANAAGLGEEARRHLASVQGLVAALEERLRPATAGAEGEAA